jgi:hypothetical protein
MDAHILGLLHLLGNIRFKGILALCHLVTKLYETKEFCGMVCYRNVSFKGILALCHLVTKLYGAKEFCVMVCFCNGSVNRNCRKN